jgi:hypothetical protein
MSDELDYSCVVGEAALLSTLKAADVRISELLAEIDRLRAALAVVSWERDADKLLMKPQFERIKDVMRERDEAIELLDDARADRRRLEWIELNKIDVTHSDKGWMALGPEGMVWASDFLPTAREVIDQGIADEPYRSLTGDSPS